MRGVDRRPVCGRLEWRSKYRNTGKQEDIKIERQGQRRQEGRETGREEDKMAGRQNGRQTERQKVRMTEIGRKEDRKT